ncbi:prepilin peptidase [Maricaulaceae bacterium EIL42A08]|nr:prepilin peptidase [Maricaulaceae bacterium EIL42A08]
MTELLSNAPLLVFIGLMLAAAWTDMARFTIPNWIVLAMIAFWIVSAPFLGLGWMGAGLSVATFVGFLAVGMLLWAPGWLGGGDVKLIAAGALWFGWPDAMMFLLAAAASGGVLALALVLLRRVSPALPVDAEWLGKTALAQGAPAPYAVAIASGALLWLPNSALFSIYAL